MLTGRLHHRHEPLPQRHESGCDVGVVVAQRPRVHAGHEKAGGLEERERPVADEREVEIARAGPAAVERLLAIPAPAGEGAPAQHDRCTGRHLFFNGAAELVELGGVAPERQAKHILPFFLVRQTALDGVGSLGCSHAGQVFQRSRRKRTLGAARLRPRASARQAQGDADAQSAARYRAGALPRCHVRPGRRDAEEPVARARQDHCRGGARRVQDEGVQPRPWRSSIGPAS